MIEESVRYRWGLRRARRAAHTNGQRRPFNDRTLRKGVNDGNGLAVLRCGHRRGDGALEDVLRMPVVGAVVIGSFDCGAVYRGAGDVDLVMMREMMVMVRLVGVVMTAVLVVFETLGSAPLPDGIPDPAIVISPSVTPAVKAAKVALPAASYAETAGTVVNFMGLSQSYSPALKPKGQALSHTEILGKLTAAAQKAGE